MRLFRILALFVSVLVLAACASPARIGGAGPAFERTGRFAMTVREGDRPVEAVQGGFSWRDDGKTLRLDLLSPMGSVLARILVRPGLSVLEHANGITEEARNPDALLAKVWGHAVPVVGLRAWIRGKPWAGSPVEAVQRDADGHIVRLVQDGWVLRLSDYDELGPGRLRLTHDQAGRRLGLQLIVDAH